MTEINRSCCDYDEGGLKPVYFDEVIMGNVLTADQGQTPAGSRPFSGSPEGRTVTVHKVCASGMKAIALAAQSIKTGEPDIVVAGGMENMSNVPTPLPTPAGASG